MFTGIVREVGTVRSVERSPEGARIGIDAELAAGLRQGDSVAVAGACLTAASVSDAGFEADVMNQTLGLTTLGMLESESRVNLEPALRAGDPLGGHLVQGHVDGTGEVLAWSEDGFARRLRIALSPELARLVVERGSVALDGVSLTVSGLDDAGLEVSLIPETLEHTTLGELRQGSVVNVELDLVARYVERLVQGFRE